MLTVERKPNGSERFDPSALHQGLSVDQDYSITARPALVAVTSGAIVRYTLLYKGVLTTVPRLEAAGSKGSPGSDVYTWFKFSDRSIIKNGDAVPLQRGLDERAGYSAPLTGTANGASLPAGTSLAAAFKAAHATQQPGASMAKGLPRSIPYSPPCSRR